uniref:5-hydroxytryptamine (serotonin) receptor 3A n=1 Tax=Fundulus heteroclitus TaxID=8078 RepID=A0A3Q2TZX1_FUNHE
SPTPDSLFKGLENYLSSRKLIRPVSKFSEPLRINISITVVGILGVVSLENSYNKNEWDIAGLSWDEEECGAEKVSVPREMLWLPDVHIAEFMDENRSPQTPYVYLYNTGHVFDDKPIRVVSSCMLEIYNFPFDVQNCSLTFGSYLHFGEINTQHFLQYSTSQYSAVWHGTVKYRVWWYSAVKSFMVCHPQLILRRRPTLYVVNLLVPSCFLVAVDLISFLLPPQSVDRSSFKMTLILGYTVFLLIMNDLLPITGDETPLINVFFSISLALMVASLLETVFITNIQFSSSQYSAVPHWLSVLVLRYLAVVVCMPPKKKSNRVTVYLNPSHKDSHMSPITISGNPKPALEELRKLSRDLTAIRLQVDKHFQGSNTAEEWQMIGAVIDRLLFCLYILFIAASFITITGIWIWNNSYAA